MSNPNKLMVSAIVVVAITFAVVMFLLTKQSPDANSEGVDARSLQSNLSSTPDGLKAGPANSTLAMQWRWQEVKKNVSDTQNTNNGGDSLPFSPKSVHDALQAVKIDEQGNIVLDHDALISLDEALERIHNKLDSQSMLELQELIKDALPGKVGQQTAQLVADYQQFLQAKAEFSQMYEGVGDPDAAPTLASAQSDQALYGELQALREIHLGADTASSLFHDSDANAEFMFEMMKVDLDPSLTPQERSTRRQEIKAQRNLLLGTQADE